MKINEYFSIWFGLASWIFVCIFTIFTISCWNRKKSKIKKQINENQFFFIYMFSLNHLCFILCIFSKNANSNSLINFLIVLLFSLRPSDMTCIFNGSFCPYFLCLGLTVNNGSNSGKDLITTIVFHMGDVYQVLKYF